MQMYDEKSWRRKRMRHTFRQHAEFSAEVKNATLLVCAKIQILRMRIVEMSWYTNIRCTLHTHHANLTDCQVHKMNRAQKPYANMRTQTNNANETHNTNLKWMKKRDTTMGNVFGIHGIHATKCDMHFAFYLCISSTTWNESTFSRWIWFRQWNLLYIWGASRPLMCMAWHGMATKLRIRMMMNCLSYIKSVLFFR